MTKKEFASYIDHTLLAAEAGVKEITKLCSEADKYGFASVCINPVNVPLAAELLKNSQVKVCTVIGFPLGASTSAVKAAETEDAISNGADEVDMVINIGAAKDNRFSDVAMDIKAVVDSARKTGDKLNKKIIVKVILETCLLTDEEIKKACIAAKESGADFVKTSTGFATKFISDWRSHNGATVRDVKLMRETVGPEMGVKASGGVRDAETAYNMLLTKNGATRIGTSSGIKLVEGWNEDWNPMD